MNTPCFPQVMPQDAEINPFTLVPFQTTMFLSTPFSLARYSSATVFQHGMLDSTLVEVDDVDEFKALIENGL